MIHDNSLESYNRCKQDNVYTKLEHIVLNVFDLNRGKAFTDREIRNILREQNKLPSGDMNDVRPKITKWKKAGVLIELEEKQCDPNTKMRVRLVTWDNQQKQMELKYA